MASPVNLEPLPLDRDPTDWFLRMEAACSVLELATGNKVDRKTFAVATLGSHAITLVSDLLSPTPLSDPAVTFTVLQSTLQNHLKTQHLEIAERAAFYTLQQRDGESTADFFSRLKKAAEHCNFGNHLDEMLRDRLVLGCCSREAQQRLLAMHPLSLKVAQDTLAIFEAVENAKSKVSVTQTGMEMAGDVHYHDKHKGRWKNKRDRVSNNGADGSKPCSRCANPNCTGRKEVCPAVGCGKLNHFKKACRQATTH